MARTRRPWWVATLLLLAFAGAGVARGQLRLATTGPTPDVAPGANLNLVVRVANEGSTPATLDGTLDLPSGWSAVVPPGRVEVAARGERIVPFIVRVPRSAPPGAATVGVVFSGGGETLRIDLRPRVEQRRGLEATLLEAPRVVVAEAFDVRFLVRNVGNVVEEVDLSARDNLDAVLRVAPDGLRLAPNAAEEVRVRVEGGRGLDRARRHQITLRARGDDADAPETAAATVVERVPTLLAPSSAYHLFPVELRLAASARSRSDPDAPVLGGDGGVELAGSGALHEGAPGTLSFRLADDAATGPPDSSYVAYRHDAFRGRAGRVERELSPLLGEATGVGVDLATTLVPAPGASLGAGVVAAHERGWTLGARLAIDLGPLRLSPALRRDGDGLAVATGARAPFALDDGALRGEVVAEAAGYASADGTVRGDALRVEADVAHGRDDLRIAYERRSRGFRDRPRGLATFEAGAALRLDDPWERVAGRASPLPLVLDARYRATARGAGVAGDGSVDRHSTLRVGLASDGADVDVRVRYEARRDDEGRGHRQAEIEAGLPLPGDARVQQGVRWRRERPQDGTSVDLARYVADVDVPVAGGRFRPGATIEVATRAPALRQAGLRAEWSGAPTQGLTLDLDAEAWWRGPLAASLLAEAAYAFDDGRTFEVEAHLRRYRSTGTTFAVEAGYVVPFDVPLGRRSDLGEVSGVLRDVDGQPLPGVVVRVGGASAATNAEGRFRFPAVPAGDRLVAVRPGPLPIDWIVVPASPHRIAVVAGEEARVELRALPAARVEGRVRVRAPAARSGDVVLGEGRAGRSAEELVEGLEVRLTRGDETRRTRTGANGTFAFDRLPPGPWRLEVRDDPLGEFHRLEPERLDLALAPGETAEAAIDLVPIARPLNVIDGGRVPPIGGE